MSKEVAVHDHEQGYQLLVQLEQSGAITATSLNLPPDLPFDQFEALAYMFGRIRDQSAWVIGDLLNYGEKAYGHKYAQAEAATGLAEQTLMNYSSVCGRVPKSRRRKGLKFSHHAEVASLSPDDQNHWLSLAYKGGWPRSRLRFELDEWKRQKILDAMDPTVAAVQPVAIQAAVEDRQGTVPDRNGDVPLTARQEIDKARVEVLPAETHICHCLVCGRAHRSDIDVEVLA